MSAMNRVQMAENMRRLFAAVTDVVAIDGISVGEWSDKSTWRIDFKEDASLAQIEAANAVVQSFVVEGL